MSGLSRVKLGCSYLDCQVLDCIPRAFHLLLQHAHPMVHQHALASFAQFASLTTHEDAVPACLKGDESLVQAVQSYVNQVPHQRSEGGFQLLQYLRSEEDRLSAAQEVHQDSRGQSSNGKMQSEALRVDPDSSIKQSSGETGRPSENGDSLSEPPTKRRKAISESDEEESSPKATLSTLETAATLPTTKTAS
ncbi:hypothetical protein EGW08_011794, partial [Elysia chlorotica]